MPGFDRTGPMGAGPMTGGARGCCRPGNAGRIDMPRRYGGIGWLSCGGRHGRGRGRGYFQGAPHGYPEAPESGFSTARTDELSLLKAQAEEMAAAVDAINRRIAALRTKPSEP